MEQEETRMIPVPPGAQVLIINATADATVIKAADIPQQTEE